LETKGSVLIIDDAETILRILEQFLSGRNYDVVAAQTGEQAIAALELDQFDAAIVDLKLPDIDGLELISRFGESHPDMNCIIMTAVASLESTIEALRLSAYDYIRKPFDLIRIGEVVEAAVNDAHQKREHTKNIQRLERANKRLEKSKKDLDGRMSKTHEQLASANESLKKYVTRLKMLYQMGRDISSNENWSDALDRFLMALCKYIEADGAAILLFSSIQTSLKVRTSIHLDNETLERIIAMLKDAQNRDTLPVEIFHLESCEGERVVTCLEMNEPWDHTVIPLLYKGRWLGFLLLKKHYRTRRAYMGDYHFITTIQTILTEEVANAVNISHLRSLKDFNETILESINNGVLKTDRTGKVIFFNSRAREILGSATEREMHFNDVFHNPFRRSGLFEHLIESDDCVCSMEGAMSASDGKHIPVRLYTTVVETDDYHGKTIVAVFEDLTDQKMMEEELRRADRLRSLGELSAGVAHEIRNPLTGIATTAQVLREHLAGEDEKIKFLDVILDEIGRLDDIITNLLIFAKPLKPRPVELSLGQLTDEALQLVSDKAGELSVVVTLENTLEDDHCMLDRDQVKQVILNIALNGIQACKDGGELTVRLVESGDPTSMRIEVTDTGEGITKEAADKLYNPFFTTRPEGTGLGLAITRKIVEQHGGRIYHRSEVGRGTTFYVELPRRMMIAAANDGAARVS
jgi:PAS domain S-box-containing protein